MKFYIFSILSYTTLTLAASELALTFTGGPDSTHTAQLLNALKAANVTATFLFKGNLLNTSANKALALRAYNEGHSVGHLGYAAADFTKLTTTQLSNDINSANAAVKTATGHTPLYVGYPLNRTNAAVNAVLLQKNLKPIIWNFDSLDWAFPDASNKGVIKTGYLYELDQGNPTSWTFIADMHDNRTGLAEVNANIIQTVLNAPNLKAVSMDVCYPGPHPVASPLSICSSGQIALTYDDGPIPGITNVILDNLKANGISATFFVVGSYFVGNPSATALLQRAYAEGHTIGSHSYTHPDFTTLTVSQMTTEVQQTETAIINAIGKKPVFFRFPYNAYDSTSFNTVKNLGYSVVEWNSDPLDWFFGDPTNVYYDPSEISSFFTRILTKRDGTRVNAVNSGEIDSTTAALPSIITIAQNIGFNLVSNF